MTIFDRFFRLCMLLSTFSNDSPEAKRFIAEYCHDGIFDTQDLVLMAVILQGRMEFEFGNETIEITSGTGIFIGSYKFRIKSKSKNLKITVCVQTKENMKELYDGQTLYQFSRLMYRPRLFHMEATKARLCSFSLYRAAIAANDPRSAYGKEIATCYIKIILYNALDINRYQSKSDNIYEKRENIIADRFISLVHNKFTTTRKVKDYAAMMGLTSKYLASNVLAATGTRASDWITDYTIREIKHRLKHSDDSIQQIAYDLNFSTPSHLTKFFGDHVGMSPLAYRKESSQDNDL